MLRSELPPIQCILLALLFWAVVAHPHRIARFEVFLAAVATLILSFVAPFAIAMAYSGSRTALTWIEPTSTLLIALTIVLAFASVSMRFRRD